MPAVSGYTAHPAPTDGRSVAASGGGSGLSGLDEHFAAFERKMRATELPPVAIETFRRYYGRLLAGATGTLSRKEIGPIESVPDAAALAAHRDRGIEALDRTVLIKLNGGLGTSMGMTKAKSLLPVKEGLSFLEIIARQILHLRRAHGCRLPLLLMNSFRTREDSLEALSVHQDLAADLPLDFLQHKVPRILASDLTPVEWPRDPEHEWCPPGHGDIYTALLTSGMLETLLGKGYEYAFVSNRLGSSTTLGPLVCAPAQSCTGSAPSSSSRR